MLRMSGSSPKSPRRGTSEVDGGASGTKKNQICHLQADTRQRLSAPAPLENNVTPVIQSSGKQGKNKDNKKAVSLSSGHKTKIRKALQKFNFLPRNANSDSQTSSFDDSSSNGSHSRKGSTSSSSSLTNHTHHLSASNPDLSVTDQYDNRPTFHEHVLRVYRNDQTCKYLLVHRETTAREVVMLALKEFGLTDPSSNYSLCEVTVEPEGLIKQKRLPDQLSNLPDRITLNGRYYLKNNMSTETLVPDEMAGDLLRENQISFLQLNSAEVAAQLMLRDFQLFRDIEPTEYMDDLFELNSKFGMPHLQKFSELVNKEMFWVVTETCSEQNVVKRMKVIKQFIKIARHCKDCKNFNSMFALVSGLGHRSVARLKNSWDRLPSKYVKLFEDLQDLMDPSRNMSKYRNLVNSEHVQPPLIPFFPVVKKDLTFIHLGNDSKVEGLVNFEKLRMIAKEIRHTCDMASAQYDIGSMYYSFGTSQTVFSAFHSSNVQAVATLRRKRRSTTIPNAKKMFEEAQMVRRVRAYLDGMKIINDEVKLAAMSESCESSAGGVRKRDPSPSPANLASLGPKFGAESPEAVRKMLALSDKVRPHNPKYSAPSHHIVAPHSPVLKKRQNSPKQKRPLPPPAAVNLSPESSSVISLSNITHKKPSTTTGNCSNDSNSPTNSVGSSSSASQHTQYETDSGLNSCASSNYESHSPGSVSSANSPPLQKCPESQHSTLHHHNNNQQNHSSQGPPPPYQATPAVPNNRPPLPPYHVVMQNNPAYSLFVKQQYQLLCRGQRPPCPPEYHVATQMTQLAKKDNHHHHHLNKSRSCDGVPEVPLGILDFPELEDEDANEEFVDDLNDLQNEDDEIVSAV